MRIMLFLLGMMMVPATITAQAITQTIRGRVVDADSRAGLPGANVVLVNSVPLYGTTTDANGNFVLDKVPVGRASVQVSYMGFKPSILSELMVSSGKQTVINVELEEEVLQGKEVEIRATIDKGEPINAMGMVSARSFTIEESRRYAGSVDDPMRAVSNFAGVAASADVTSNEIVIRGNSPKGLLWRVDGMDIPNPNHFAYVGTSGGGTTMFSSQVLSNSDFYTAAFPSEYGNALSGVFDMRFRNGNSEKHEFAFQLGIQGIEAAAEGPFSKKAPASYLFNYRYSILGFIQYIDPEMKNKVPSYQDLSFKIAVPTKKAGTFALTGIGGISRSAFIPENDTTQWSTLEDRTRSMLNNVMGAAGITHQIAVSRNTYIRSYISGTYNNIEYDNSYLSDDYTALPQDSVRQDNFRIAAGTLVNRKFSAKHTNRTGISYTQLFYNSDIRAVNPFTGGFSTIFEGEGNTGLIQAFSESKLDLTARFTVIAGLHFQYFLLNRSYAVEPRVALRWQAAPQHTLSLGYGKHSQTEEVGVYLTEVPVTPEINVQMNRGLDFSRSHHFVLGYEYRIRPALHLKAEAYYQYLYHIPVMPGTYYSLINSVGGYYNDTLANTGTGRNIGLDITFEKYLTKQYYFLVTLSLFDSKYTGGDDIRRNTKFNSNYVANLLGGKEWTIRKKNILGVNLKASYTGGEYYVPIDLEQSVQRHSEVLDEAKAYTQRLPSFLYLDLTVTYRTNHRKFAGIWALQVKNILNQKPAAGYVYNDFNQSIEAVHGMGIIPFISYKVEF